MRRQLVLLLALVAALVLAGWAPATASAQDNTAVAVNTKDGTAVFKLAFKIHRVTGEVVDNVNAAVAVASCQDCQAIAVAFHIVLVASDPEVVTPQNVAIAVNYECASCVAFAAAYQRVLGGDGPLKFTKEGKRRLKVVRRRLKELSRMDLTLEGLVAELEAIQAGIADILATELEPGKPDDEDDDDEDDGDESEDDDEREDEPTSTEETTTEETTTVVTTTEPTTTEGTTP